MTHEEIVAAQNKLSLYWEDMLEELELLRKLVKTAILNSELSQSKKEEVLRISSYNVRMAAKYAVKWGMPAEDIYPALLFLLECVRTKRKSLCA